MDKEVSKEKYDAEKGSVIITLKPDYLETLSVGKHTLSVSFSDAVDPVKISFTVNEKKAEPAPKKEEKKKSANTSDPFNPGFWAASGTVALLAVAVLYMYRRKLQNNH